MDRFLSFGQFNLAHNGGTKWKIVALMTKMEILEKSSNCFVKKQNTWFFWFFTKIAITQPRMIQIPKFWCLKSCTNIWLHFGNIHSIQKINRIELEGKKGSKFAKIGQFFTLQKIKIEFSQKFPKVWFHGFFLSLPTYED